jgi:hypothetical protein
VTVEASVEEDLVPDVHAEELPGPDLPVLGRIDADADPDAVADHLREAALAKMVTLIERERDYPGRGWNDHAHPEESWSNGLMRGIREGMTAAVNTIRKGF